jgi:hypothetical protein
MDYGFFESSTPQEADTYLRRFLETEKSAVQEMTSDAKKSGISADFLIESVAPFLSWVLGKLKTTPRSPDQSLPEWIRKSASYQSNLFDFDEASKVLILRSAYYLGESFVRSFPMLSWATGNLDTAVKNMPVITGFRHQMEMAPMLVLENVFGGILSGSKSLVDLQKMVSTWIEKVNHQ